jgi:hypothetical protein
MKASKKKQRCWCHVAVEDRYDANKDVEIVLWTGESLSAIAEACRNKYPNGKFTFGTIHWDDFPKR